MDELDVERTIGVGSFGRVRLVVHRATGRPYALKSLQKRWVALMNQVQNVRNEYLQLTMCSHPFLNKLAAAYQDDTQLYMVLEFVQGGELSRLIGQQPNGVMDVSMATFHVFRLAGPARAAAPPTQPTTRRVARC